jgi:hypothetical protein
MFTWLSSKAIRTLPVSTSVTDRKTEAKTTGFFGYLPSTSWLTTGAKSIYGLLPRFALSGSGFSVNGFNFDLMNIPKNLRLLLSFCFITSVRADDFYFRDPTGTTNYKLEIEPKENCGSAENLARDIMRACTATASFPPYPKRFDHLQTTQRCISDVIEDGVENFYRATNDPIQVTFENCMKTAMYTVDTLSTKDGIILWVV